MKCTKKWLVRITPENRRHVIAWYKKNWDNEHQKRFTINHYYGVDDRQTSAFISGNVPPGTSLLTTEEFLRLTQGSVNDNYTMH